MTHKHKIARATVGYLRYWNASASPPICSSRSLVQNWVWWQSKTFPWHPIPPYQRVQNQSFPSEIHAPVTAPQALEHLLRAAGRKGKTRATQAQQAPAATSKLMLQTSDKDTTASASKSGQYPPVNTIIRIGYVCFNVKYSAQIKFSLQKLM